MTRWPLVLGIAMTSALLLNAGCKSAATKPDKPPGKVVADPPVGSTDVVEPVAKVEAPPAVQCPAGSVLTGKAPPKGAEQWCAEAPGGKGARKHGPWVRWHKNGKRQVEGAYDAGAMSGHFTYWHPNGQKSSEGDFAAGKRDGRWQYWNTQGFKTAEAVYAGGAMVEQWTYELKPNGSVDTRHVRAKDIPKQHD